MSCLRGVLHGKPSFDPVYNGRATLLAVGGVWGRWYGVEEEDGGAFGPMSNTVRGENGCRLEIRLCSKGVSER